MYTDLRRPGIHLRLRTTEQSSYFAYFIQYVVFVFQIGTTFQISISQTHMTGRKSDRKSVPRVTGPVSQQIMTLPYAPSPWRYIKFLAMLTRTRIMMPPAERVTKRKTRPLLPKTSRPLATITRATVITWRHVTSRAGRSSKRRHLGLSWCCALWCVWSISVQGLHSSYEWWMDSRKCPDKASIISTYVLIILPGYVITYAHNSKLQDCQSRPTYLRV